VRVSVLITDENPLSTTEDLSVSSRRDEKINAKGIAGTVGPSVWRLAGIINVQYVRFNQLSLVSHQAGRRGNDGFGGNRWQREVIAGTGGRLQNIFNQAQQFPE